jgi:cyclic-di-GMP phosphodiesterase TipF (flagellum assembly factor)
MPRSGSFFVALCMVAIAVSAAVLAYVVGFVEVGSSAAIGFGLLLVMVIGHFGSQRAGDRLIVDARLAELARATGDMARDVAELSRRVERFETTAMDKAKAATEPIAEEIGELGALVKQFAETLQVHEAAIVRATAPAAPTMAAPPPRPVQAAAPANAPMAAQLVAAPLAPPLAAPPPAPAPVLQRYGAALRRQVEDARPAAAEDLPEIFAGLTRADAIAIIDEAITAKRYELFLQPIVTLPQRKVRSYQASVRLRGADGAVFLPGDYRSLADDAGLMPGLDSEILGRCIQVIRRLASRNRDVSLVCDIAGSSLADAAFSTELVSSLEVARSIAGALVLGFRQEAVRAMSPLDIETLRALSEKGFRFSMDGVGDLRIEPRDLADKGFRHVKVPAELMTAQAADAGASIHVADLAGLFGRYGIDLIVEGIETETMVVDLLDYDVKLAQGFLFSPPRPVRADVLATGVEPAGMPPAAQPAPRQARAEPRVDPRPAAAPQTLGAAALAAGAVGTPRDAKRPGIGQGLRALIRDRS